LQKILLLRTRRRNFFIEKLAVELSGGDMNQFVYFDSDLMDPVARLVPTTVVASPSDDAELLNLVSAAIIKHQIKWIIPWLDKDILVLMRNQDYLRSLGAEVFSPPIGFVELSVDKLQTENWFSENNLTSSPLLSLASSECPLIAKPRYGQGGVGVRVIAGGRQLKEFLNDQDSSLYVFQKFIEGTEYTIDVFQNGEVALCVVPRRRLKVRDSEALISKVELDSELLDFALKVVSKFNFIGLYNIQVIRSSHGVFPIEINPRFGGGSDLSIAAGANLPKYVSEVILHGKIISSPPSVEDGLIMSRYYSNVFFR
jgi:carbamoyl-phosphate synthase large subunit